MNKEFLAALIIGSLTFCFIAVLNMTSFERLHTHEWPSNQAQVEKVASSQDSALNVPLTSSELRKSTVANISNNSLQHYDHKAQILMAFFTFCGLAIAGWGLVLITQTLNATRKGTRAMNDALEEAKDATKAAWAAVDVAKNSERAWVGFYTIEPISLTVDNYYIKFKYRSHYKNSGKSPAFSFYYFRVSNEWTNDPKDRINNEITRNTVIHPIRNGITLLPNDMQRQEPIIGFGSEDSFNENYSLRFQVCEIAIYKTTPNGNWVISASNFIVSASHQSEDNPEATINPKNDSFDVSEIHIVHASDGNITT